MSVSKRLRLDGNEAYKAARTPGLSHLLASARASKAFDLYSRAASAASGQPEAAAAYKNLGRAALLLLQLGKQPFAVLKDYAIQVKLVRAVSGLAISSRAGAALRYVREASVIKAGSK